MTRRENSVECHVGPSVLEPGRFVGTGDSTEHVHS